MSKGKAEKKRANKDVRAIHARLTSCNVTPAFLLLRSFIKSSRFAHASVLDKAIKVRGPARDIIYLPRSYVKVTRARAARPTFAPVKNLIAFTPR